MLNMAKKIAAPYKAARKAPAAKKAPLKKMAQKAPQKGVAKKKLPATLDWGKKVPKDHLSYLSKEEMALLQKHRTFKGRRNYRGVPAFPDPGDTKAGGSTGLKDGASTGSKTTTSGSGISGSKGGGASTQSPGAGASSGRGAGTGQGGSNSGSRGAGSNYGPGSGRPGTTSGGGNYNSGVSGSRNGGVSTQRPGMGNARPVSNGPASPMAGQGTSFKNPLAARQDILNKVYGVEDIRGIQNMPQQPFWSGSWVENPNYPNSSFPDMRQIEKNRIAKEDRENREIARNYGDDYMNPDEIRAQADRWKDGFTRGNIANDRHNMGLDDRRSNYSGSAFENRSKLNSDRLPDTPVGSGRNFDHFNSGWRAGGLATRMKAGGLVKSQPRKTFKKK